MPVEQKTTSVVTGVEIPAFLKGTRGPRTKSKKPTLSRERIVLLSRPGKGKSSLLFNNPKAFVLDMERGGEKVKTVRALSYGQTELEDGSLFTPTLDDYREMVNKLIAAKKAGNCPFDTVGIDTVNSWIGLHTREICTEKKVTSLREISHGNAYDTVNNMLAGLLMDLETAGFGWIALVQIADKTIRTKEGEMILPRVRLSDGPRNEVMSRCDYTLYLADGVKTLTTKKQLPDGRVFETVAGEQPYRYLLCEEGPQASVSDPRLDVKVRVKLPEKIEISQDNGWGDLETAFKKAVTEQFGES